MWWMFQFVEQKSGTPTMSSIKGRLSLFVSVATKSYTTGIYAGYKVCQSHLFAEYVYVNSYTYKPAEMSIMTQSTP